MTGSLRRAQPIAPDGPLPARHRAMQHAAHRWVEVAGADVLVVDPDTEQPELRDAMAGHGVHLTWVSSTTDALVAYGRTEPRTVVVAAGTPGLAPVDFVTAIRRHGSPYVIASGDSLTDPAAGVLLVAGACAWLPRPYAADDLWEALSTSPYATGSHGRVVVGPLELDAAAYRVALAGRRLPDLPLKEFELLRALMLRSPDVVCDADLLAALWGSEAGSHGTRTVAMHATRLRARLGGVATVRRIRGRGYALSVED
ncbi:response regulator transcription factor [Nocardioides dongxiaopingii]|uniref:response regulator transcription factor n=1 Tax=Nocardioides dongxiaopingii TaxID=2576036 RepID=UPI0010C76303|nr:winged helix-turn-helix domain-containing protein [Nocardioides dongxiaopingii]